MPIYEYRCSSCGHELEALQKFSDAPLVTCPSCSADDAGQAGVRRRLPVEGQRLVRHRLQGRRRQARPAKDRRRRRGRGRDRRRMPPPRRDSKSESKRESAKSETEDRSEAEERAPRRPPPPRPAPRLPPRSAARQRVRAATMKRYLIAGLLVWVPLGITIWVLQLPRDDARPDAAARARSAASRGARRLSHSRPRRRCCRFVILLVTGVVAANFFGAAPDPAVGERCSAAFPSSSRSIRRSSRSATPCSPTRAPRFARRCWSSFRVPGCWTIAFLTGAPADAVVDHLPGEHVSVYVPTTPNPTGGYFVMVPRAACASSTCRSTRRSSTSSRWASSRPAAAIRRRRAAPAAAARPPPHPRN